MAANGSSLNPSRSSTPLSRQLNGSSQPIMNRLQEHGQISRPGWQEPKLRAAQPSFMDNGIDRSQNAVLAGMMPLGTFPPTKKARKSGAFVPRRSTPLRDADTIDMEDDLTGPTAERELDMNGMELQDSGANTPAIDPALQDVEMPTDPFALASPSPSHGLVDTQSRDFSAALPTALVPPQPPASQSQTLPQPHNPATFPTPPPFTSPFASGFGSLPTPTNYSPFPPPPPPPFQPPAPPLPQLRPIPGFDKAFAEAQNSGIEKGQFDALQWLRDEVFKDRDLGNLLIAMRQAGSQPPPELQASWNSKIKQMKKIWRREKREQEAERARAKTPEGAIEATANGISETPSISINNASPSPALPADFDQVGIPITEEPAQKQAISPRNTRSRSVQQKADMQKTVAVSSQAGTLGSPLKQVANSKLAASRSRRGTSPLSEVDEDVAAAKSPSPLPGSNADPRSKGQKRPAPDPEDIEFEQRRKRMRQDFSHVVAQDSSERPEIYRAPEVAMTDAISTPPPKRLHIRLTQANALRASNVTTGPTATAIVQESNASAQKPPTALGRPPKNATKQASARTINSPQKVRGSTVSAGVSRRTAATRGNRDKDKDKEKDKDDCCTACGDGGFLIICSGCGSQFHNNCLDPPMSDDAEREGDFKCYDCKPTHKAEAAGPSYDTSNGVFGVLLNKLDNTNPSSFALPLDIRDYFEGVATGSDGEYVDTHRDKPQQKSLPTNERGAGAGNTFQIHRSLVDAKGKPITCHKCNWSSENRPGRELATCDFCGKHFHLDCLDPPMAKHPKGEDPRFAKFKWQCPLHVDHDLRQLNLISGAGVDYNNKFPSHKVRKPKRKAPEHGRFLHAGLNTGLIEIESDTEDEWYDADGDLKVIDDNNPGTGQIHHYITVPAKAVKLDFIARVKSQLYHESQVNYKRATDAIIYRQQLEIANQERIAAAMDGHTRGEQTAALNLANFANDHPDVRMSNESINNLVAALKAEVASDSIPDGDVTSPDMANNFFAHSKPPVTEAERAELLQLQELITRRLFGN